MRFTVNALILGEQVYLAWRDCHEPGFFFDVALGDGHPACDWWYASRRQPDMSKYTADWTAVKLGN